MGGGARGREALEELFDAYLGRWAEPWAPGRWSLRRGRLPGEWSLSIPWGERCLGVVGLNSAAASVGGAGKAAAQEHLDVRQLHGVCDGDGPRWLGEHDLCLLLTHHGPSDLSPASLEALRGAIDVPGRFLAHLHGSVSASALVDAREGKAQLRRRFAAGPLGLDRGGQGRGGGYIIGCLERGEGGRRVTMRLWPRSLEVSQDGVARFGVDRQVACEEDGGTPAEHVSLRALTREADEPGPPPAFTDDPEHDARALLQWSARGGDGAIVRSRYAQIMERTDPPVTAARPTAAALVGPGRHGSEPDGLLAARFQLLERLGQGGFGEVWGAYDREARRPVVIKRLRADGHHPPGRRAERARHFRAGAEAMARVDHRGLVSVLPLDASTVVGLDGVQPFYAMRWLLGGNLLELVGGYVGPGASLAPEQRVLAGRRALARALEGLAYLHEQGVVHRDVKPNNILLDEDLRGYLGDFDLVRDSRSTLLPTRIGGHVYIAPELVNGWGADARADVYAAGMCALFVLTGQDPPQRVEADAPELIDGLDCEERLKAAIRLAVNPRREARPERCAELIRALRGDGGGPARRGGGPTEVNEVPAARRWLEDVPVMLPEMSSGVEQPDWVSDVGEDRYGRWASFEVEGVVQRMRYVEAGTYTVGSPADEPGRYDDEFSPTEVSLDAGLWVADTPCTQAMWRAVMGANPSRFISSQRPVEQVSWHDVQGFFAGLELRVPGLGGRLPTEREWEVACRAGTVTATYAGPMRIVGERHAPVLDAIAWYGGNSGVDFDLEEGNDSSGWKEKQYEHSRAGTREVGLKVPNAWGLYDTLGNVWEWCSDEVGTGPERVARGGSSLSGATFVRAACRVGVEPGSRIVDLGFRLVRGQ